MKSMHNLAFRIQMNRIDTECAKAELESYVRDADRALNVDLLCAAELCADYATYEQLRQAAVLVRKAMNTLYKQTQSQSTKAV